MTKQRSRARAETSPEYLHAGRILKEALAPIFESLHWQAYGIARNRRNGLALPGVSPIARRNSDALRRMFWQLRLATAKLAPQTEAVLGIVTGRPVELDEFAGQVRDDAANRMRHFAYPKA